MTGERNDDDLVLLAAIAFIGVAVAILWAGAQLSARLHSGVWLTAGLEDVISAAIRLPAHGGDPAQAWRPIDRALLPGARLYWGCTIGVVVLVFTGACTAGCALGRRSASTASPRATTGTGRRVRLGVDSQPRLARRRDLSTLLIRRANHKGRFVLGVVHGRLAATEDQTLSPVRGLIARGRQGDRMGVAVIGPTRCGKTANLIGGVLEWSGPAILSSVKGDILDHTLAHRRRLGEVKVFDPTRQTKVEEDLLGTWSPLRDARSATGAQRAARAISAVASTSDRSDASDSGFWQSSADQLLWPLLFAARWGPMLGLPGGMEAILNWLTTYETAAPIKICSELIHNNSQPSVARDAISARSVMIGLRDGETKLVQSIYQTAQPMLRAIQDPLVLDSTNSCNIDFEWLCDPTQANTLYVCSPTHDQQRLGVIFGGLFGDLLAQQAYEHYDRHGPLDNPLLVLMDEAANTPCSWLPNVVSTCSGVGVLLVTVWQDIAQIHSAYGRLGGSVLNNHGTKIFYAGQSDLESQRYLSAQAGRELVPTRSVGFGAPGGRHVQVSNREAELIPTHILREMRPGGAVIMHGSLRLAQLKSRRWWKIRRLHRLSDGSGSLPAGMPRARHNPEANPDSKPGPTPEPAPGRAFDLRPEPAAERAFDLGPETEAASVLEAVFRARSDLPRPPEQGPNQSP